MSVARVARDDFGNAARSYVVLGTVGISTLLVALVFSMEYGIYDHPYRTLWDVSALVAFVFPLLLAPLTYLAIAGDRTSGTIMFTLGLPNSRLGYVTGTFCSRFGVAAAAVVVPTLVGFVVAAATYADFPDLWRFLAFAGVSTLFAFALTGLFLAISAAVESRARAMMGVLGAYFLLVPFWFGFFPVVSLTTLLDVLGTLPGVEMTDSTRDLIRSLSPATAYFRSTEVVYGGVLDSYDAFEQFQQAETRAFYERQWFAVLVMLAWGLGSLALGYLSFARSELG